MSTARSSTRPRDSRRTPRWLDWKPRSVRLGSATQEAVRATRDVRHLLRFRSGGRKKVVINYTAERSGLHFVDVFARRGGDAYTLRISRKR